MKEIWRPVVGYEGHYEISNLGRVKSLKFGREKILKLYARVSTDCDYKRLFVVLSKDCVETQFYVHKLVAAAFPDICGHYFEGAEIDHIDGDATNNEATNLRFVTHTANMNNPHFIERKKKSQSGKRLSQETKRKIKEALTNNAKISRPLLQYDMKGNLVKEWPSYGECKRNGFSSAYDCATGRQKSCKDKNGNRFYFIFK